MSVPRGFGAFLATLGALAWALGFGAWALAGSARTTCTGGACSREPLAGAATSEVVLVWAPAAVCLVAWFLLRRHCTRGSRASRAAVAAIVAVSAAFSMLAMLSIGALLLPIALLLWLALASTPAPRTE
jgi:hypothetical protein